jgi:hypothetical protein
MYILNNLKKENIMSNSNYINKKFKDAICEAVSSSNMSKWVTNYNSYNEMHFKTEIKDNRYFSVKFKYDSKSKIIHWELNEFKNTDLHFISEDKFSSLDIENFKYYCNKIDALTKIVQN